MDDTTEELPSMFLNLTYDTQTHFYHFLYTRHYGGPFRSGQSFDVGPNHQETNGWLTPARNFLIVCS